MCVSVRQPPIGQVGDGLVSQGRKSLVDDGESVDIVLPESPGDDVVAHVQSERPAAIGGASLEADGLAGLVHPVVRVAPGVGGGADGVGDVGVGSDVLGGGGHCLVLSIPAGWLVLPADALIMLSRAPWVNPHEWWPISQNQCLWSIDRQWAHVVYARARTYIYYGRTQALMIKLKPPKTFTKGGAKLADSVTEYAASEMKYWCTTGDYGGTGYAQDNRWTCYWNSNDAGWKTGPGDMDCSSGVAGAYNVAFHNVWGTGWDDPIMFPRTGETWTETLNSLAANRGFMDIGDTWYGTTPSGGFQVGDLVLKTTGDGGHVAMCVRENDGSFNAGDPLLAEAWINENGDISEGQMGDQTGYETHVVRYSSHPMTVAASWSTCIRFGKRVDSDNGHESTGSYRLSSIQEAVLRAADAENCPWWAALACLWMETGERGANIYGHDVGGAGPHGEEVTEENFREFLAAIRDGENSNGVGPLQITYPGYFFDDPDREWWMPEKSAEVGCRILRDLINAEGDSYEALKRVGSRYNSGNPYDAYESYGILFSNRCKSWYDYGRPSGGAGEEFWDMSEGVDLLREIRDLFRSGKAGDHFAGDMNWYAKATYEEVKSIHASVDQILHSVTPGQENVREAGAIYGAVNEIRKAVSTPSSLQAHDGVAESPTPVESPAPEQNS